MYVQVLEELSTAVTLRRRGKRTSVQPEHHIVLVRVPTALEEPEEEVSSLDVHVAGVDTERRDVSISVLASERI
jgi:hypothetical protein